MAGFTAMPSKLFLALLASSFLPFAGAPQPTPSPSPSSAMSAPSFEPRATASPDLIAEGDTHYARRSVGAVDGVADRREVDVAIALYRKALEAAPRDIETTAKLMRALHFRGAYTGADLEAKKALFNQGRLLGQAAVDRLEAEARATPRMSRIEALRLVKGAPALYLWTAGHWGEWGLSRGKFTAARSGVASKLRDLAQTVVDLDPGFDDAAGYRILGRLHSEAPKIPFVTGWVSHKKGLQYLRRAHRVGPNHPVTWYFLAEAILEYEPEKRDEALRLLEMCASRPGRPGTVLEDAQYARLARKQLDQLRSTS